MAAQSETLIAQRAYEIWEKQGRPHGHDQEHWQQAVAELAAAKPARKTKMSAGAKLLKRAASNGRARKTS